MENISAVSAGREGAPIEQPLLPVSPATIEGHPLAPPHADGLEPPRDAARACQPSASHLEGVWREVRKRVFLKVPFSPVMANTMEAVVPITVEGNEFVVGFSARDYPLAGHLLTDHVRKAVENILRAASGRPMTLEVVEGTTLDDWERVRVRRSRAQEAVLAAARQHAQAHHLDDMLNQIVGEIRQRVTCVKDRALPQVRAQMILDIAPALADAEEMLLPNPDCHDARRAMSRALDRVASFLDVQPIVLALEVERCRRQPKLPGDRPAPERPGTLDA